AVQADLQSLPSPPDTQDSVSGGGAVLATAYSLCSFFQARFEPVCSVALQSLGHLFVTHPRLMQRQDARDAMAAVFHSGSVPHRLDLVRVFAEYLREEQKRMTKENDAKVSDSPERRRDSVDIHVLIGNAEEMGDASVSSSIMQMYLDHLLDAVLSLHPLLTTVAFDVVCTILEQGLVHPVLCVPHVIAMQTSDDSGLRTRAVAIYEHLAEKHKSLIHAKNADCVRKAFEYRSAVLAARHRDSTTPFWVPGYILVEDVTRDLEATAHPVALLSHMFAKITIKNRRHEFLSMLVRGTDFDASATT
ncbi:Sister chromatid cohesion protein 2, partial [Cladochytrium tenue]